MKTYNFTYVDFAPFPRKSPHPEYNPNYIGTWQWGVKGVGFGEIAMYQMPDGRFWFDAEMMSKDFIKQMLCHAVDKSLLDHETEELPEHFKEIPEVTNGQDLAG
jgi:hypothetical protein